MKQLPFTGMLRAAGISVAAFRSLERRGRAALACGAAQVTGEVGRYFDLDSASLRLTANLGKGLGQDLAAKLVRSHADFWLSAVALADAQPLPIFFVVSIYGEGEIFNVAAGTMVDIIAERHEEPRKPTRMVWENVTELLATVRANAKRHGIDLSAAFFPAPGSELYDRLTETVRTEREAALARAGKRQYEHRRQKELA